MAAAAATHPECGGPVVVGDAAALPFPDATADCLVAFMSLQDVDAMETAVCEAARVVAVGGRLVMAITHPLNTAGTFVSAGRDASTHQFVIGGSWFERRALTDTCERDGYRMTFHSEHRPLQTYTEALADAGFVIERLREIGEPDAVTVDKWHNIPLFLHSTYAPFAHESGRRALRRGEDRVVTGPTSRTPGLLPFSVGTATSAHAREIAGVGVRRDHPPGGWDASPDRYGRPLCG